MKPLAHFFVVASALATGVVSSCAKSALVVAAPVSHGEVTLTYLGVAGWQIASEGHVVLIDPYVSRLSAEAIDGATVVPDDAAIAAHTPAHADAILVSHSHFDHVLDVPSIAKRSGAQIIGSQSTANLARAAGVPTDQIITVKGGEDFQFDGFSVRAIASLHSALDDKHSFGGASLIDANVKLPMAADGYLEGGTFAYLVRIGGKQILVLGTANFIERELEGIHPDVAIVATGLRDEIYDYSCRLMHVLGDPPLVIANHFDAWKQPYGDKQMAIGADSLADLQEFPSEIHSCSPTPRVEIPQHGRAIALPLR